MSHTCNVEEDGLVGDIDKSQVRNLYTTAGHQVLRAGADLFTALSYVETLDFEDGTDDLQECADRLDKAVGNLEEATDLMAGGLPLVEEVGNSLSSVRLQSDPSTSRNPRPLSR